MGNFCWGNHYELGLVYLNPNRYFLEGCWCCSLLPSGYWGGALSPVPGAGASAHTRSPGRAAFAALGGEAAGDEPSNVCGRITPPSVPSLH